MARSCSICGRPDLDAIDNALSNGSSLDEVVKSFGLPSRSALQRHRASHLGRAVTLHLPPMAGCPPSTNVPAPEAMLTSDAAVEAELNRMLARADRDAPPSVQQVARVAADELLRVIAAARLAQDRELLVRALRELRGLLDFHARVPLDRLTQGIGWTEAERPSRPDPIGAMMRLVLGPVVGMDEEAVAAQAELDAYEPGLGTGLAHALDDPAKPRAVQ